MRELLLRLCLVVVAAAGGDNAVDKDLIREDVIVVVTVAQLEKGGQGITE